MDEVKVLTFNSWGLLYVSKDVEQRMVALAEELAKGCHDVVCLQEIWSQRHYKMIKEKVKDVLPYSHYFHSGVLGSGCATFSLYPIIDSLFYQYLHNGYFWDITHGDWFAGKGVGCVILKHPKKNIYCFNTHLHADYGNEKFLECRTLQAYQLSQVVNHVTRCGDAVLVCGDFNHKADEIGIKSFLSLTDLNDSYKGALEKPSPCHTLNPVFNHYNDPSEGSKRIDYIFTSDAFDCLHCDLAMQKVEGSELHFSDHEGYKVTLKFKEDFSPNKIDNEKSYEVLKQIQMIMKEGERTSLELHWRKHFMVFFLFLIFIYMPVFSVATFYSLFPTLNTWQGKGVFLLQVISIIFCAVYLWVVVVVRLMDIKAFKSVSSDIAVKLDAIKATNTKKYN